MKHRTGTSTRSRCERRSTISTKTQIKPYFELNKVLENGVFYAATQLYGITFKERHDIPVYHPDVRVFDVFDTNGKQLALFYCDYFKRDNKNGGAWMDVFVNQSKLLGTLPVVYNVANLPNLLPDNRPFSVSAMWSQCSTSSGTRFTVCSRTRDIQRFQERR